MSAIPQANDFCFIRVDLVKCIYPWEHQTTYCASIMFEFHVIYTRLRHSWEWLPGRINTSASDKEFQFNVSQAWLMLWPFHYVVCFTCKPCGVWGVAWISLTNHSFGSLQEPLISRDYILFSITSTHISFLNRKLFQPKCVVVLGW